MGYRVHGISGMAFRQMEIETGEGRVHLGSGVIFVTGHRFLKTVHPKQDVSQDDFGCKNRIFRNN
jgi:hypothetical protein